MEMNILILIVVCTYLFAAIPFGLVFAKLAGLGDIRTVGSGNIGATNVLRTGNKKVAILTLLFDALKGAVPVLLSAHYFKGAEYMIGLVAIFSHIFPIYLKFKGGKGVATTLGVYLAWNPLFGLLVLVTWVIVAKVFKISSLSALVAAVLASFYGYFIGMNKNAIIYISVISITLLFTHRENIKRILNKQESLIS